MLGLLSLNNLEDYFKVKSNRKPVGVYFCRIIGYDNDLLKFLRRYQTYAQTKGTYINNTINNPDLSDIQYLCSNIDEEFNIDINIIKKGCSNLLKFLNEGQVNDISYAIYTVLDEMAKTGMNINILKNAYIKFIYWIKFKFQNSVKYIGQDEIPKILYEGDIGKYEFYMLRILSLAGCDVIYINFISEETYKKNDPDGKYSFKLDKPIKKTPEIHFSKIDLKQIEEREKILSEINNLPYKIATNEWLTNDNFFDEIKKENVARGNSEINNMFIKYIGIDSKDEYNNRLYNLRNNARKNIVIIENEMLLPNLDEVSKYRFEYKTKEDILFEAIKRINVSKDLKINKAVKFVISEYINNLKESNLSKIFNNSIKMLCFFDRYVKKLFANFEYKNLPILIYFGEGNQVEATFLCMISKLPVDVIYINPKKSGARVFSNLIIEDKGKIIELPNSSGEKMKFPNTEVKVRANTVAYNAERELDTLLYNDTGMFRDKQFKTCEALTLKTTYDEIFILWKEQAKYRPNFEVRENKVILPNIFAKISGVKDGDINSYYKLIQETITEKTILIKGFPYIKKEAFNVFYGQANKFVSNNKIDKDIITNCKDYKYGFLNINTQNFILNKIQEMIDLQLIVMPNDLSINQKIVSTLLNLNKETLRLIQQFDFTKEIPKVVIIDADENIATWQDSILLVFFNLIGFDIIVYTPTGYQNIEKYIRPNLFDEYQIGDYVYNFTMPKLQLEGKKKRKGFFGR